MRIEATGAQRRLFGVLRPCPASSSVRALLRARPRWLFPVALVALVFLYRGLRFLKGTPINHWPRGNKPADDAPFIKRVEDAHANCLENLPIFAAIVLSAAALGKLDAIDAIAPCVISLAIIGS